MKVGIGVDGLDTEGPSGGSTRPSDGLRRSWTGQRASTWLISSRVAETLGQRSSSDACTILTVEG